MELDLTILEWVIFIVILLILIESQVKLKKIIEKNNPYVFDYRIDFLLFLVTVAFVLIWGGVFWW